jgi:serine/threonine-protein kinase
VQVPDFTNRTANEASGAAAGLGLALKVDDMKRTDTKIGAGRILAQEPAAGSTARRQRTVKVWLSAGPRATIVPVLTGESERTAQLRLTQNGFALTAVSEIRSQDFPADVVVAQEPPPKTSGAAVSLLVNRGDRGATYVMPDLIGVNGDRASEVLRQRGFRMAVVGSNPYPGIPAGVVLRQNPQAGFQIAPGEPISLEVSR